MNVLKVKTKFLLLNFFYFVFQGWIEPLLDPIARNPKAAIVPLIEIIDDSTFQFTGTPIQNIQVGGFDWNLIFNWHVTPEREMKRRQKKTDPIRSPTMAGGLFSIDREWFEQLGMYDPGMDIWGGENLELSFKVNSLLNKQSKLIIM